MKTRAAVAFEAKQPLEIVELDLEGPKAIVISRGFNGKEISLVVFIRGLGGKFTPNPRRGSLSANDNAPKNSK